MEQNLLEHPSSSLVISMLEHPSSSLVISMLEHPSSSLVISTICVAQSLFFCVVLFLLYIVLSVLLRFTTSDYHFGIFKLFLNIYFFSNCTDRLTKGRILISNIFVYSIYVISVRRSDIVI